jgi:hypothetical protein
MRHSFLSVCCVLLLAANVGCTRTDNPSAAKSAHSHGHEHKAPHGGTAIVLGNETYHLELVRDAAAGTLTGYVLDGHMEAFIRTKAPTFTVVASVGGEKRPLTFKAVANPATGETAGDTSQFEAQADWLKTTATFEAVLTSLDIRGTKFENVAFHFPNGNEKH